MTEICDKIIQELLFENSGTLKLKGLWEYIWCMYGHGAYREFEVLMCFFGILLFLDLAN